MQGNMSVSCDLSDLLGLIHQQFGFDFTGYKPNPLLRQVVHRMEQVRITDYAVYKHYLERVPGEFQQLFNTMMNNHTTFFRNPEVWQVLADEIIPRIVAHKQPARPIRVWSAGCASGQEAYSLAMLFAEALGLEQLHKWVTIYATDVDRETLEQAYAGRYPVRLMRDVPQRFQDTYFERVDQHIVVRKELRRAISYKHHNLISDAPLPHIDLLVCRNALLYFMPETHAYVLAQLHSALADDGVLVVGTADMCLPHRYKFRWADYRHRIAAKWEASSSRWFDATCSSAMHA